MNTKYTINKAIWDSMLDAELNYIYWGKISRRYYKYDTIFKIFLAIMTSGTVAIWSIWTDITCLWKILSSISALTAISLPFINFQELIHSSSDLRGLWFEFKNEYECMWLELNSNNDLKTIEEKYIKMKNHQTEIIKMKPNPNLPHKKKLIYKCYNAVIESRSLK